MFLFDTFLYFNMELIIQFFQAIFHPCYKSCISKKNSLKVFRVPIQHHDWLSFQSPLHERDDLSTEEIWKPFYSSSGEHLLQVAEESNQSREEPEIVADEDDTRDITAPEALKKFYELKNFIEVNGSDHLNMIFSDLIENVEQMKLKSQKQSDIRSFFRS